MSQLLRPRDQGIIELSSINGDTRSQTKKQDAFGDYEKPFISVPSGVPLTGDRVNTPGTAGPRFVDPTVCSEQTFRIPEGMSGILKCSVFMPRAGIYIDGIRSKVGKIVNSR